MYFKIDNLNQKFDSNNDYKSKNHIFYKCFKKYVYFCKSNEITFIILNL